MPDRRWSGPMLAGVASLATLLAACGPAANTGSQSPVQNSQQSSQAPSTSSSNSARPTPTPSPSVSPVSLTANVKDGAEKVPVDTQVAVSAANGTLTGVSMTYKGTTARGSSASGSVSGSLSSDGKSWSAGELLEPNATYKVVMKGKNAEGATTSTTSKFKTAHLSLSEQTYPTLFPSKGSVVGVGMPVILTFDVSVHNHKAFEKRLKVTSSPAQQGTWSWVSNREVHYRPKVYWQTGTKVDVQANLNGVNAGHGIFGQTSASTHFTIGRSVVTNINLASDYAKVYINGKMARNIPVSGGKPGFTTRSGAKLVMEKLRVTRMRSETIGIAKGSPDSFNRLVEYAMRVTPSGEFVHAAPWNVHKFGKYNGSHGCVGMSTANASWLYSQVLIGSPVITTGSKKHLESGNGWTDWNISYAQFAKGSAL